MIHPWHYWTCWVDASSAERERTGFIYELQKWHVPFSRHALVSAWRTSTLWLRSQNERTSHAWEWQGGQLLHTQGSTLCSRVNKLWNKTHSSSFIRHLLSDISVVRWYKNSSLWHEYHQQVVFSFIYSNSKSNKHYIAWRRTSKRESLIIARVLLTIIYIKPLQNKELLSPINKIINCMSQKLFRIFAILQVKKRNIICSLRRTKSTTKCIKWTK